MTKKMQKLVDQFGDRAYLYGGCMDRNVLAYSHQYIAAKQALVEAVEILEKSITILTPNPADALLPSTSEGITK